MDITLSVSATVRLNDMNMPLTVDVCIETWVTVTIDISVVVLAMMGTVNWKDSIVDLL